LGYATNHASTKKTRALHYRNIITLLVTTARMGNISHSSLTGALIARFSPPFAYSDRHEGHRLLPYFLLIVSIITNSRLSRSRSRSRRLIDEISSAAFPPSPPPPHGTPPHRTAPHRTLRDERRARKIRTRRNRRRRYRDFGPRVLRSAVARSQASYRPKAGCSCPPGRHGGGGESEREREREREGEGGRGRTA